MARIAAAAGAVEVAIADTIGVAAPGEVPGPREPAPGLFAAAPGPALPWAPVPGACDDGPPPPMTSSALTPAAAAAVAALAARAREWRVI